MWCHRLLLRGAEIELLFRNKYNHLVLFLEPTFSAQALKFDKAGTIKRLNNKKLYCVCRKSYRIHRKFAPFFAQIFAKKFVKCKNLHKKLRKHLRHDYFLAFICANICTNFGVSKIFAQIFAQLFAQIFWLKDIRANFCAIICSNF